MDIKEYSERYAKFYQSLTPMERVKVNDLGRNISKKYADDMSNKQKNLVSKMHDFINSRGK